MKVSGTAAVTNNGDISNASVVAGPIDVRPTFNISAIMATIAGAQVAGTLQLQGAVGAPIAPSQGPGAAQHAWAGPWVNVGNPVTFTGAGSTAWDIQTGFSALQVVWTKTGTSSSGNNGLVVTFNEK